MIAGLKLYPRQHELAARTLEGCKPGAFVITLQ